MSANAKDRSTIVSGAGFVSDFMIRLIGTVKEKGGIEQDLHILVRPEGKPILDQIAGLLVKQSKQIFPSSWKVLVLPVKSPSPGSDILKEWKDAGELDEKTHIDKEIIDLVSLALAEGDALPKNDYEIVLVNFNKAITAPRALQAGLAQGLKKPTIQEIIIGATQNPDIQREGRIIVPDELSVHRGIDDYFVLCLSGQPKSRRLFLKSYSSWWAESDWFVFVRN